MNVVFVISICVFAVSSCVSAAIQAVLLWRSYKREVLLPERETKNLDNGGHDGCGGGGDSRD